MYTKSKQKMYRFLNGNTYATMKLYFNLKKYFNLNWTS